MTDEATKLAETLALGKRLLEEWDLKEKGWTFDLSNHKVIMGQCRHNEKKVLFSLYFLDQPMEEIEDTIKHEIAHALVGSKHSHDAVWRRMCIRVGARPERCYDDDIKSSAKPNYYIECDACKKRYPRYRLKRNLARHVSSCCSAKLNFYRVRKK